MDFEKLLKCIVNYGVSSGVMIVLIWQLFKINEKMLEVISHNSSVIEKFTYIVEKK